MQPADLRARLEGPIGFPVTPFRDDLSLDLDGLRRNVRALLAHPPAAVVAAGGTGELYSLTPAEHHDVLAAVVDECAGRVPVIAGVGFNAVLAAQLAAQSAAVGANGILAFPPYYPNADEGGLAEYYRVIGDASPLGLLIYSRDWFHPGPALLERLAEIPTLVAWKDGQGDLRRLQILMAALGDRLHWIGGAGDDMVPAYYAAGVRAYTSSVSNVSSRLARQLHDLACARTAAALSGVAPGGAAALAARGDALDEVMRELVVPLYAMRARRRGYEVTVMKDLMNLLGLAGGRVRPPLPPLAAADRAELEAMAPLWRAAM